MNTKIQKLIQRLKNLFPKDTLDDITAYAIESDHNNEIDEELELSDKVLRSDYELYQNL